MRRALLPGLALIAIAALIAIEVATDSSDPTPRAAAALPSEVLVGPRATIAGLRGRPAAVNFWASWCEPCRRESPQLERLFRSLEGRASLVGVDYSDDAASARALIHELHLTYPNLRDGNGEVGDSYGLTGLPTTAILDSQGRVVRLLRGPQTAASVRGALRSAQ
jgi:cytochrome c biogenesis protein CcmG, thiol:disulfide interchange protein DsbE